MQKSEEQVEECDKKKDPSCEKVMEKCDRAREQCKKEMKEACGKPMEPIEKVLGEKQWHPDLLVVDRHVKEMDPAALLMAGSGIVLGGLAILTLLLAPIPTPLIPALPGLPGPQFLSGPKLENHEKCGLVGVGKVGTLS